MSETDTPNNDEVICPNCCHQFRAIPVNVQHQIADLKKQTAMSVFRKLTKAGFGEWEKHYKEVMKQ